MFWREFDVIGIIFVYLLGNFNPFWYLFYSKSLRLPRFTFLLITWVIRRNRIFSPLEQRIAAEDLNLPQLESFQVDVRPSLVRTVAWSLEERLGGKLTWLNRRLAYLEGGSSHKDMWSLVKSSFVGKTLVLVRSYRHSRLVDDWSYCTGSRMLSNFLVELDGHLQTLLPVCYVSKVALFLPLWCLHQLRCLLIIGFFSDLPAHRSPSKSGWCSSFENSCHVGFDWVDRFFLSIHVAFGLEWRFFPASHSYIWSVWNSPMWFSNTCVFSCFNYGTWSFGRFSSSTTYFRTWVEAQIRQSLLDFSTLVGDPVCSCQVTWITFKASFRAI